MNPSRASRGVGQITELEMAGHFDTGRRRAHNEDYFRLDAGYGIAIVADGMGGHNAGEVASRMAVDTIYDTISSLDRDAGSAATADANDHPLAMRTAIEQANDLIKRTASNQPQYEGMGTTVAAAVFRGATVSIGSVGDSRVYRLRRGRLEQLTRDHTLLQELVDRGYYSEEEAHASLNRNIVTRALGVDSRVEIDLIEDVVLAGDRYLLCSDGLNNMVTDDCICSLLAQQQAELHEISCQLIEKANANGGRDNITAAIVDVRHSAPVNRSWLQRVVDWFQ